MFFNFFEVLGIDSFDLGIVNVIEELIFHLCYSHVSRLWDQAFQTC